MNITSAEFVISAVTLEGCPNPSMPEYAFIGRSNVGKSSLINALTNRNKLAKTSVTPGKTKLINHFLINKAWYLADLPGYGYAKVSKAEKAKWEEMTREYIIKRTNLMSVFLLIDSRHAPQKPDLLFSSWLGENEIPFSFVFTKTDKLSKKETDDNISTYINILKGIWEELPAVFISSSVKKTGLKDILNFIEGTNPLFRQL